MFTIGNNPNSGLAQFHDFWECFGIFIKATKLINQTGVHKKKRHLSISFFVKKGKEKSIKKASP